MSDVNIAVVSPDEYVLSDLISVYVHPVNLESKDELL